MASSLSPAESWVALPGVAGADDFDSIPIEILGRIYERLLDRHRVRKAAGVYYTPDYIVSYMVEQALEPLVRGKSAEEILSLRIVDTACGAGAFLIGAFSYLMKVMADRRRSPLNLQQRREILVNCIHGVDIDPHAVEVAQLSLHLKLLEGETGLTARKVQTEIGDALLASLMANVVAGNSLFPPVFPRAAKAGGFDLVIGNPPYVKEYTNRRAFDQVRTSPYFEGKMDLWYLFACIGIDLLKSETGVLAYIVTNNWVTNSGAKKLRAKIAREARIERLIDFGDFRVFRDAGVQTMILHVTKTASPPDYAFDYRRLVAGKPNLAMAQALLMKVPSAGCEYSRPTFDRARLKGGPFAFSGDRVEKILRAIEARRNFELDPGREIAQGIVPNPDVVSGRSLELIPLEKRQRLGITAGQGVFVVEAGSFSAPTLAERQFLRPLYQPSDVDRYSILRPCSREIIYSTRANTHQAPLPSRLREHLEQYREIMEARRENRNGRIQFFHLHWPRDERFFAKGPKILAVRKCERPVFAYTEDEAYGMMAFNFIVSERVDLLFLTALLNSRVVEFWLRYRGKLQGQHFQVDREPLLGVPLCVPSESEQRRICGWVRAIVGLGEKIRDCATGDAELAALWRKCREIDERVQGEIEGLYGVQLPRRNSVQAIFSVKATEPMEPM